MSKSSTPPPSDPFMPLFSLTHHSFNWIKLDFPKSPTLWLQTDGITPLMGRAGWTYTRFLLAPEGFPPPNPLGDSPGSKTRALTTDHGRRGENLDFLH